MSLWASATAGFLVAARWLSRRRAVAVVAAAAATAAGLGWMLSGGTAGRREAWIEFVLLLGPLFAVGVGAFGAQVVRGRDGGARLAAAPVAPAGWVLGQGAALVAAVLVATLVVLAPGAAFLAEGLYPAWRLAPPEVEGRFLVDHGRRWAPAGDGALTWSLPAPGAGDWEAELRIDTAFYRGYQGGEIVYSVTGAGGLRARVATRTEAPLRVRLPAGFPGGRVTLVGRTAGVAAAAAADGGGILVSRRPGSAFPGWLALGWLVVAHAMLLGAVALAGSLLVSPVIAVIATLTVWVVGWSARFLAAYAEAADLPSVFAAWSGATVAPGPVSVWLHGFAAVVRRVPDLSGGAVADALGRGHQPEWGLLLAVTTPHLLAALGLLGGAAALAALTWKRCPGTIPGERGLF